MSKIRVLVADDSAFMRGAVARLLSSDERFEVVGQAKDGLEAVSLAAKLQPDVATMDFNMPGCNGAEATSRILAARKTGIVMLSAHTLEGARETLDALSAGAFDFVTKPGGEVSTNVADIKDDLIQKLCAAYASVSRREVPPAAPSRTATGGVRALPKFPAGLRVVVLAASTGGPAALEKVFGSLPERSDVALLVVQHMPGGYTAALAERLDHLGAWRVREARDRDKVEGGIALVAPGGSHLEIDRSGVARLTDGPPVHGVRPAADVTLRSAAVAFGARVLGVVMTGMGRDGVVGLAAVKSAGGATMGQDAASSTVYGMPKAAAEMGVVDHVVGLADLAGTIDRITR